MLLSEHNSIFFSCFFSRLPPKRRPDRISVDEHLQVFTVRIWREPRELANAPPYWRGVIIHLESGAQGFFNNLAEMIEFITPYLESMGTPVSKPRPRSFWRRLWQTLRQFWRRPQ